MRRPSRRKQAGQMVPLFAILAIVLFAFAALALDGGLALSDRRSDQNIADNSALAGALDLETVTVNSQQTAVSSAITYAGSGIGLSSSACPTPTATSTPSGSGYTIACTIGAYDVTAYTPPSVTAPAPYSTTDARHMVEVRLTHHNTPALMRAANLGNVLDIGARAVAVHGIPIGGHPHAVWSTECKGSGCQGGGNTLALDGTLYAEVDSGPDPVSGRQGNGLPCDDYSIDLFSNEKLHVGNPASVLDINGGINHSMNDNEWKKLYQYWVSQPAQIGSNVTPDLTPPYLSPTTTAATYHTAYNNSDDPAPTGTSTLVFSPGHYTKSLTVGPGSTVTLGTSTFTGVTQVEFLNGVYFFDNGANVVFDSNTITSYSQDFTLSGGMWTATTFTPANFGTNRDTTTDGVEFYMGASAGYFWAKQGNVYLQGPSNVYSALVPTPTPSGFHPNHVTVFVDQQNNSDTTQGVTGFPGSTVTNPLAIGSDTNGTPAYPSGVFHEQGVVLVQNTSNNQSGSTVFLAPTSLDYRLYAVQGQAVAPYVGLNVGNVTGAQQPTTCQDDTLAGKPQAGKLVQYSPKFVPTLETGMASGLVS